MADQQWYYSHGDEQLGPVGDAQIKRLARKGELTAADLVWKEGMADWTPAGQVDGLLSGSRSSFKGAPPAPPAPSRSGATPPVRRPAGAYLQRAGSSFSRLHENAHIARQAALFLGITLVITARGCDGLGARNALRLEAKYASATKQFDDEWDLRRVAMRQQLDRLGEDRDQVQEELAERRRAGEPIGAAELKQVNDRLNGLEKAAADQREQMDELVNEQQTARRKLEDGHWRDLQIAARDAQSNNAIWAYWRGALFVAGSLVFSIGLLLMGFHGQGAERWICLAMLAIIVFSLYVGGLPWISGLNALSSGTSP